MLAAPPIIRPSKAMRTDETARKFYTLHHTRNTAFCIPGSRDERTAMVSFNRITDIMTVGTLIESHVNRFNEWPELDFKQNINVYSGQIAEELKFLIVNEWSLEELRILCAASYLDLLHIDKLKPTSAGYTISGNRYIFNANQEFYAEVLKHLYDKE
jgi:hypothetical protein